MWVTAVIGLLRDRLRALREDEAGYSTEAVVYYARQPELSSMRLGCLAQILRLPVPAQLGQHPRFISGLEPIQPGRSGPTHRLAPPADEYQALFVLKQRDEERRGVGVRPTQSVDIAGFS
jgi:hypothetical protein